MTARKLASNIDANGLKVTNLGVPTAASNDAARMVDLEAVYSAAISRANHSGTQIASTISDFDTQVRTSRLDQFTAPTGPVGMNSQQLTGLADPDHPQDAATMNYVDTSVAALVTGQTLKGAVVAASATNVDIASAPATIDGITPGAGNIFLLYGQNTGTENGPYVWTGAGAAMTRALNWNTAGEAVVGSYWIVEQGTQGDRFALMSNDTFTLDSSTMTVVFMGASMPTAVQADMGNGAATSFPITHNFGTRAVNVVVHRNASPYDEVDVAIERTDTNTVTVKPDSVWSENEFHVVVSKM